MKIYSKYISFVCIKWCSPHLNFHSEILHAFRILSFLWLRFHSHDCNHQKNSNSSRIICLRFSDCRILTGFQKCIQFPPILQFTFHCCQRRRRRNEHGSTISIDATNKNNCCTFTSKFNVFWRKRKEKKTNRMFFHLRFQVFLFFFTCLRVYAQMYNRALVWFYFVYYTFCTFLIVFRYKNVL